MDKQSVVRTLVLVVALVNQFLVSGGLSPVPGTEEIWGQVITAGITGAVAVWTWFKNNYIMLKGRKQKQELQKKGLE